MLAGLWLVTTPLAWSLSVVLGALLVFILWHTRSQSSRKVDDNVQRNNVASRSSGDDMAKKRSFKVIYATQTGTAKTFAERLYEELQSHSFTAEILRINSYDPEDCLPAEVDDGHVCVFIMATYTDGQSTDDAAWFMKWLGEAVRDFRVQKMMLNGMNYAVFGLGNSLYEENYNKVARNVDEWLGLLSAKRVISVGLGDNNVVASIHGGIDKDFSAWKDELLTTILQPESKKIHKDIVSVQCSDEKQNEEIVENGSNTEDEGEQSDREDKQTDSVEGLVDLEDMGDIMDQMKRKKANRVENGEKNADNSVAIREMITPALRQSLSKQGYRLIGSHSGVKMCRWTKVYSPFTLMSW
jgi:tRNA wybutosine-synthesizing protein 1